MFVPIAPLASVPTESPVQLRATHCRRGHERTPENIYIYNGYPHCKVCQRLSYERTYQRKKPRRTL